MLFFKTWKNRDHMIGISRNKPYTALQPFPHTNTITRPYKRISMQTDLSLT